MKYITEFTAQDVLTNVNYYPYSVSTNPTMGKLKEQMTDLYRTYIYVNEFILNYCTDSASVRIELGKGT